MQHKKIPEKLFSDVKYIDGNLFWSKPRKGSRLGGMVGSYDKDGYIHFCYEYSRYKVHRVIWEMFNGPINNLEIDHINGNKSDNRIENLRLASRSNNEANKAIRKNNTSGFVGVSLRKSDGRWLAKIRDGGRHKTLGAFMSKEEAAQSYAEALVRIHGKFANVAVVSGLCGLKPDRSAA